MQLSHQDRRSIRPRTLVSGKSVSFFSFLHFVHVFFMGCFSSLSRFVHLTLPENVIKELYLFSAAPASPFAPTPSRRRAEPRHQDFPRSRPQHPPPSP